MTMDSVMARFAELLQSVAKDNLREFSHNICEMVNRRLQEVQQTPDATLKEERVPGTLSVTPSSQLIFDSFPQSSATNDDFTCNVRVTSMPVEDALGMTLKAMQACEESSDEEVASDTDKPFPDTESSSGIAVSITDSAVPCPLPGMNCFSTTALKSHLKNCHTSDGDAPYSCGECEETFPLWEELTEHVSHQHAKETDKGNGSDDRTGAGKSQGIPEPFTCEICGAMFELVCNLKRHLVRHQPDNLRYSCSFCSAKFAFPSDLKRHVGRLHTGPKAILEPMFGCDLCDGMFPTQQLVTSHKTYQHADQTAKWSFYNPKSRRKGKHTVQSGLKFPCEFCSKAFIYRYALKRHVYTVHKEVFDTGANTGSDKGNVRPIVVSEAKEILQESRKPVASKGSTKARGTLWFPPKKRKIPISNRSKAKHQMATGAGDISIRKKVPKNNSGSFRCDICSKQFIYKRNLKQHFLTTHEGLGSAVASASVSNHKDNVVFSPGSCKDAKSASQLVRVPEDSRELVSQQCAKTPKTSTARPKKQRGSNFRQPQRVSCDICGKVFPSQYYLERHKKRHSSNKPYACTYCSEKCVFPSDLKRHVKAYHTGPKAILIPTVRCGVCDGMFPSERCLGVHQRREHLFLEGVTAWQDVSVLEADSSRWHIKVEAVDPMVSESRAHEEDPVLFSEKLEGKARLDSRNLEERPSLDSGKLEGTASLNSGKNEGTAASVAENRPEATDYVFHPGTLDSETRDETIISESFDQTSISENEEDSSDVDIKPSIDESHQEASITFTSVTKPRGAEDGEVVCDICTKPFNNRTALNRHMQRHSNDKPFACSLCSEKCVYASDLKKHELYFHSGKYAGVRASFPCDLCGGIFMTKRKVSLHQKLLHN